LRTAHAKSNVLTVKKALRFRLKKAGATRT